MPRYHYTKSAGFTLLELIIVIVLVGIISVTAASRYFGANSISAPVYRDQLISSLRLSQMRAMQSRDVCHRWLLAGDQAGQVDIGMPTCTSNSFPVGGNTDQTAVVAEDILAISFSLSINGSPTLLPHSLDFDSLGRINQCREGCRITIQGSDPLSICIEKEGYIHACH